MTRRLQWTILLTVALMCVGCSGSTGTEEAGPTVDAPAAQLALAPHTALAALLPSPADWERADISSAQVGMPAPASHAATSYTRGDARIDMELTDTGGEAEYVEATAEIAGSDFNRTLGNGYLRGTRIGGFPAVESWNHVDRLAEITVLIEKRFVVHASGSRLDGIETLRAFIETVSFADVAALKAR